MLQINNIFLDERHDKYLKSQRNCTHKDKLMYIKGIIKQYKIFKNNLPKQCDNILSIGCGLGVPDLIFKEHYKKDLNFYLFDRHQYDNKISFGYKEKASFYNNFELTKEIYNKYGIDDKYINFIDANNENLLNLPKMDIIISLIAWGFHFPIRTYLENVVKLMHENTILIFDLRTDHEIDLIREKLIVINDITSGRLICKLK
jgi:hypothetical protein